MNFIFECFHPKTKQKKNSDNKISKMKKDFERKIDFMEKQLKHVSRTKTTTLESLTKTFDSEKQKYMLEIHFLKKSNEELKDKFQMEPKTKVDIEKMKTEIIELKEENCVFRSKFAFLRIFKTFEIHQNIEKAVKCFDHRLLIRLDQQSIRFWNKIDEFFLFRTYL